MSTGIQNASQGNAIAPRSAYVRERGVSVIHDGGSNADFDVVFIHGIQGHPINTWTYHSTKADTPKQKGFLGLGINRSRTPSLQRSGTGQGDPQDVPTGMWPATLLRKDFPNARILTYGYDSQVSNFFGGGANQNDMFTIANGFLNDLAAERVNARGRDLIIISHSMGGLITKEALRRASVAPETDSDLRDILNSTFALIFFGTPHRGGAYTNLGLTATKVAKAAGFSVNDQNIRDLKGSSPVLTLIRQGFNQLLESSTFHISTFQESIGYSGFGWMDDKVVPNESSELGYSSKERTNFINANHMNMCRFIEHDDGYIKTKGEIKRHLERRRLRDEAGHSTGTAQMPAESKLPNQPAIAGTQLPDETDSAESFQSLVNNYAMPGQTDLILMTTTSCQVEYATNECLSYQRLQEPREVLSYKKWGSGFGSSQRLYDYVSSMIDHIEERVISGERTQKFINIWCPPCCHMLMTAEVIASRFRRTGERNFLIHVVAEMPVSCCKDTSIVALVGKMQTIRRMVDDPDLRKNQDPFDARPFYSYNDIDHAIYHIENATDDEFHAKARQNSVEHIVDISDMFARLSGYCSGIILAEADLATDEWKHCSPRFQPYATPFKPNQYFSLSPTDFTWNPKAGVIGALVPTYKIRFMGTWV
ncbi:hypothetical protein N7486_003553 [Penicillium sp. IBT 16267x]|nr:hypothetical protein N7486_003553 [Penicillium sp. IBT 16267x]